MQEFAQRQDSRDDQQDEKIRQLEEENDGFLKYTAQDLTDAQKAQVRANIGAAQEGNTDPAAITTDEIDGMLS